jgi:hypothetical protein
MATKQNPFLEAFEAKLEANYRQRLDRNSEMDRIAFMKTVHEELGVGPGRALNAFNAFNVNKTEVAETILKDYGPEKDKKTGDKQILHTKSSYAKLMRRIFCQDSGPYSITLSQAPAWKS